MNKNTITNITQTVQERTVREQTVRERTVQEHTILIYLEKDNKYLMMLRNKKKNDLNKNKYLGVGGHIEANETKEQALVREVKEETDFDLIDFTYNGKVHFIDQMEDRLYQEIMYVYTSNSFKGSLKECNEGTFYWINKEDVINCKIDLWEGDKYFLRLLDSKDTFDLELRYEKSVFKECIYK